MALILNLETATTNCSVSVAKHGELRALKEYNTPKYSHSEQLHVFIGHVLREASVSFSDLDAIAVSKGPGSYTGLRIGVSAAKGLCFALDIPLISIATLDSMAHQSKTDGYTYIIPLLDARRMEVYSKVFDSELNEIRETRAEIIDETSFEDYLEQGKVLLLGNGAGKCRDSITHANLYDNGDVVPSAKEMAILSHKKFKARDFENVAYFEPYYLKDFIGTVKKS